MNTILLCQHCGNKTSHIIIADVQEIENLDTDEFNFDVEHYLWFTKCNTCQRHSLFHGLDDLPEFLSSVWPKERELDEVIPKKISKGYQEAIKVKKISKPAFLLLIRKVLEILCKHEKAEGKYLYHKIQYLGNKGAIPKTLTDMAHMIRFFGNEEAHAEQVEISDHEIDILDDFFLAIIEYLYIAPEKIKKLKELVSEKMM
jgi:hypothetical protein